jgi:hypothetical protein
MTSAASSKQREFDTGEAARFLGLFDPESPNGQFTFVMLGDKKPRDNRLTKTVKARLTDVAGQLQSANQRGAGIFVAINKLRRGRRCAENVTGLRGVCADFDGAPIDPVWDWKLPPHIVVESSPGKYHAYWRVDSSVPLERFGELQRKLATVFNSDPAVANLAQIMRLPGAWHQKAEPFKTRIVYPAAVEGAGQ